MTPKFTRALIGLAIVAVVALCGGTARADVSQTAVATACPAGFDLLSVTAMEAIGPYYLPRLYDSGGNNDGFVCGHAQPDSVRDAYCKQGAVIACELQALGLPHYVFKDDDNPAYQAP